MVAIPAAYGAAGRKIGRAVAERISVLFIDRAVHDSNVHEVADALEQMFDRGECASDVTERVLAELSASSQLFGVQGAGFRSRGNM